MDRNNNWLKQGYRQEQEQELHDRTDEDRAEDKDLNPQEW